MAPKHVKHAAQQFDDDPRFETDGSGSGGFETDQFSPTYDAHDAFDDPLGTHAAARHAGFDSTPIGQQDASEPAQLPELDMGGNQQYAYRRRVRKRHHHRHSVAPVLVVLLLVILGVGGFFGLKLYSSARQVRADAKSALAEVDVLSAALKEGDSEGLSAAVDRIRELTDTIHAEVNTPLWNVATFVPFIGSDVRTGQTLASIGVELVDDVLVPVTNAASGIALSEIMQDGSINVGIVETLTGPLLETVPAIRHVSEEVQALPEPRLRQVADIVDRVREPLEGLGSTFDMLDQLLPVLPRMLGANGQTRNYLVIAQTNSELRSLGGLPGSWGVVSVTDGVIDVGEFESYLHQPDVQVYTTEEEKSAIQMNYFTDSAQLTFFPDFPRVGEMGREYFQIATTTEEEDGTVVEGTVVDGVIAIDPVFLQRMMALTGASTEADGIVVDGTNVSRMLLHDIYAMVEDGQYQDEFFSVVARGAASSFLDRLGEADLGEFTKEIARSAEDRRLYAWMADEQEQAAMVALGVDGAIPTDETKPVFELFINDDTYSKISWYLAQDTQVGIGHANADGTMTYHVTTTLTNKLTQAEMSNINAGIWGFNGAKRDDTDMLMYLYLFAPAGGRIESVSYTASDFEQEFIATYKGVELHENHISLLAGERCIITYDVVVPAAGAAEQLAFSATPLAQEALQSQNVPER